MSHEKRKPSVQLTLDKSLFNKLVSILELNSQANINDENLSSIAEKLKKKMLTYSVPRINDSDTEFVDVRYFQNEASDMIWQLLVRIEQENIEDYYSILINNREKK